MSPSAFAMMLVSRFTFTRYLLASICALSADMALFLALVHAGSGPSVAAIAGYSAGLILHWAISIRFVFNPQRPTTAQRMGFVASAAIGLCITTGLVTGMLALGSGAALAKLVAVPASFLAVYAMRKYGVFASA